MIKTASGHDMKVTQKEGGCIVPESIQKVDFYMPHWIIRGPSLDQATEGKIKCQRRWFGPT